MTTHPPTRPGSRTSPARPARAGLAAALLAAALLAAALASLFAGCADQPPTPRPSAVAAGRLVILGGAPDHVTLAVGPLAGPPHEVPLPAPDASWLSADATGRLVLTLPDGSARRGSIPDPSGAVVWEPILVDAAGPAGTTAFVVPDPAGTRFAAIQAAFGTGAPSSLLLTDAVTGASRRVDLGREAHGWAPAWLGADRVAVLVFGPTDTPSVALVDAVAATVADGPPATGGIATSANGARVAILGADGRTLDVRSLEGWPGNAADPGARLARIDPPAVGVAAALALDRTGDTLAVVWSDDELVPRWVGLYRSATDWGEAGRLTWGLGGTMAAVAFLP